MSEKLPVPYICTPAGVKTDLRTVRATCADCGAAIQYEPAAKARAEKRRGALRLVCESCAAPLAEKADKQAVERAHDALRPNFGWLIPREISLERWKDYFRRKKPQ